MSIAIGGQRRLEAVGSFGGQWPRLARVLLYETLGLQGLGRERLDALVQAGLLARCLIFMHDALVDHFVYDRHGFGKGGCCSFSVVSFYGPVHALNVGAHHGSLAGVMCSALL